MKTLYKYSFLTLALLPVTLQAAYYRWTDTKGEVHYSNSVPPSDAQLGHVELTKSGMKKKIVVSSKRAKELQLLAIKQAREDKIAAEKLKLKRIQEAEDNRLLYIFTTESELTESYNAKLRLAQLTIDLLKTRHKAQSDKLENLEKTQERTSSVFKKNTLNKEIELVIDNLKVYQQAITENLVEKDKVQKDYKTTLNRYKRLTAAAALKHNN